MAQSEYPTMDAEAPSKHPPQANGLKRRQSEVSDQESKRPRTSPGKNSPAPNAVDSETSSKKDSPQGTAKSSSKASDRRDSHRKSGAIDEKQRSRRLFGGLLGSLSQTGDRTTKKRQEIESRRKAELQRQDDERIEDKQKRLEQLSEKRKHMKRKIEEETMRDRHDSMLSKAGFLQTSTEPKLFYKPWELRLEEEDRIYEQIRQAKAQIADELAETELLDSNAGGSNGNQEGAIAVLPETTADAERSQNGNSDADEPAEISGLTQALATDQPDENGQAKSKSAIEQRDSGGTSTLQATDHISHSHELDNGEGKGARSPMIDKDLADHDDEHMVEGEEDTVIY